MATASLVNWQLHAVTGTLVILAGVTLVGFAHGLINAPIVTHITHTQAAGAHGVTNAAACYRLMERVGHVLGPMIMGQLFLHVGISWSLLGWVAVAILVMGALFLSPHEYAERDTETRRT